MKRIAVLIATTAGPVLVERITPEPALQSMICVSRQSDVLPISLDYDDFVRLGSGVILREFGPYEEGAFRCDVSDQIGTGHSWKLGVFAAHAIFKHPSCELSSLEDADHIVWLTGTVDYDLNVGTVEHVVEKVEASAHILAKYIARKTPITLCASEENARFLQEEQPPTGMKIAALKTTHDLMQVLELSEKPSKTEKSNLGFWVLAGLAALAIGAIFTLQKTDSSPQFSLSISSDQGKTPVYHFGDDLSLIVQVNQRAWVNCQYQQVDGQTLQIYPNDQMKNISVLSPHVDHVLAGNANAPFVIRLGPPAGQEVITCSAKTETGKETARDEMTITLKP